MFRWNWNRRAKDDNQSDTPRSRLQPELQVVPNVPLSTASSPLPIQTVAEDATPARKRRTRECVICRDDLRSRAFPKQPPTGRCTHDATVCTKCLTRHMSSEIDSHKGDLLDVMCPMPQCRARLEYLEVKQWASASAFERFDTLLLRKQLQKDPDFRWCKSADCGSGQIHEGGHDVNIVTCSECGSKSCFTHDVPWHTGITCEAFDRVLAADKDDVATRAYCARSTKPCPGCSARIEKNSGCDHMTCRPPGGCGYEFCWSCLADYTLILREGNHHHRPTCQYYAAYERS